jgi:hypothetical protein
MMTSDLHFVWAAGLPGAAHLHSRRRRNASCLHPLLLSSETGKITAQHRWIANSQLRVADPDSIPTFRSATIPATTDRLFPGPAEIESHDNRRKGNAISPAYGKVADVSDRASLAGVDRRCLNGLSATAVARRDSGTGQVVLKRHE